LPSLKDALKDGTLSDDALLDIAIQEAEAARERIEREEMDAARTAQRARIDAETARESLASSVAREDRAVKRRMAPPTTPRCVTFDSEIQERLKWVTGSSPTAAATTSAMPVPDEEIDTDRARVLRARETRRKMRNRLQMQSFLRSTAKGSRLPPMMARTDGLEGDETPEEIARDEDLRRAHRNKYASYLVRQMKVNGLFEDTTVCPPRFIFLCRFDVTGDTVLMHPLADHGPLLEIALVMSEYVIHAIETDVDGGIKTAVANGDIQLVCTPLNVVHVLPGARVSPTPQRLSMELTDIPYISESQFGKEGAPCEIVLKNVTWQNFPITKEMLQSFR